MRRLSFQGLVHQHTKTKTDDILDTETGEINISARSASEKKVRRRSSISVTSVSPAAVKANLNKRMNWVRRSLAVAVDKAANLLMEDEDDDADDDRTYYGLCMQRVQGQLIEFEDRWVSWFGSSLFVGAMVVYSVQYCDTVERCF